METKKINKYALVSFLLSLIAIWRTFFVFIDAKEILGVFYYIDFINSFTSFEKGFGYFDLIIICMLIVFLVLTRLDFKKHPNKINGMTLFKASLIISVIYFIIILCSLFYLAWFILGTIKSGGSF